MILFDTAGNLPRPTITLTAAVFLIATTEAAFPNEVQKTVSALLAHRGLPSAEAALTALDDWVLKDIGFDRDESGSALINDALECPNGMQHGRSAGRIE